MGRCFSWSWKEGLTDADTVRARLPLLMMFSPGLSIAVEEEHIFSTKLGPVEERMMTSGMHTVSDIFCCCCGQILGWKYVSAHDKSQKYKEGKFVLERGRISEDVTDEANGDARLSLSDAETA